VPLFKSRSEIEVTLDRTEAVPGDTIRARVDATSFDGSAEGARVELLYRNTYCTESTDNEGHTSKSKTRADVIVATSQLTIADLATPFDVTFDVPASGPASADDLVEWCVRARIDRRRRRDPKTDAPLTVRATAESLAHVAGRPGGASSGAPVEVVVDQASGRPGDTISGRVQVRASERVKARAIEVRLRREHHDGVDRNAKNFGVVELLAPVDLGAGEAHSLPFSISIPADASPTIDARHSSVKWFAEAALDMRLKKDPHHRVEIAVHNA
jgi:sporulation-control protein spo0M